MLWTIAVILMILWLLGFSLHVGAFNFQAGEQPAFEWVCRRLTGSAIDHSRTKQRILVLVIDDGRGLLADLPPLLEYHSDIASESVRLTLYFASWNAQTRKSMGGANFTATTRRFSNGIICRK
jgi:hypothetical protein